MIQFKQLSKVEKKETEFILKDFVPLPKYAVSLLVGSGGVAKSTLALQMASKYLDTNPKAKVALWLTEDYEGHIRKNYDKLVKQGMTNEHNLDNMLLIVNEPPQLALRDKGIFKANYEAINKIGEELIKAGVEFVVFDPLLAFYGGNENDNSEARVFIQAFAEWAKVAKITTLIIHHSSKGIGGGSRGASAFVDGVRCAYHIDFIRNEDNKIVVEAKEKGLRVIKLIKDNWGAFIHFKAKTGNEDYALMKVVPEYIPIVYEDKKISMPKI